MSFEVPLDFSQIYFALGWIMQYNLGLNCVCHLNRILESQQFTPFQPTSSSKSQYQLLYYLVLLSRMPKYREKVEGEEPLKYKEKDTYIESKHQQTSERDKVKRSPYVEKKQKYRQKETGGYDYDPEKIDQNTVIPKLPIGEDIIPYPDKKGFQERQDAIRAEVRALKNKRQGITNSRQFKEKQSSRAGENNELDELESLNEELGKLRDKKSELLKEIKSRKEEIGRTTDGVQEIDRKLKSLEGEGKSSQQALKNKLAQLESDLITAALSPKEEKALNKSIEQVKRELKGAASFEDIQIQRTKLRGQKAQMLKRKHEIYDNKKPFNVQFQSVADNYDSCLSKVKLAREKLNQLKITKKQIRQESQKERAELLDQKDNKKKAIQDQIDSLLDKIDLLWEEFDQKVQENRKQQLYIKHINWMSQQQQQFLDRRRREKERLQSQKLFQQRKKKREEREAREAEEVRYKPKKYTPQVQNCMLLIGYCEKLIPKDIQPKAEKQLEKLTPEELEKKLNDDSQWKKQKGVTLVQSKKTTDNDDQNPVKFKKTRRNDNASDAPRVVSYTHDFHLVNLFQALKTTAPETQTDLQRAIDDLKERKAHYQKMNQQEGQVQEQRPDGGRGQTYREKKQEEKQARPDKLSSREEDFPQI